MNAMPVFGRTEPALSWAFTYALPNESSTPMTSPVDFISGPKIVSTPGNRANGNTGDFTQYCLTVNSAGSPKSDSFFPIINFAAIFARGTPVALLTNGRSEERRVGKGCRDSRATVD